MKNKVFISIVLILLIGIFCLLLAQPAFGSEEGLTLIKSIGDERENYTMFGIADALLTDNKDICILNARGNFISIYDWQGNFKEKFGQGGQGPGDFYFPRKLAYFKNKLYVQDHGNRRIVEIDLNTRKFNFYKENEANRFSSMRYITQDTHFLGVFYTINENRGRIGFVDDKWNIITSFFKEYPIDINLGQGTLETKAGMPVEKVVRITIANNRFEPICDYDEKNDEILVSFRNPDNPVRFFVYNRTGKLLKSFSYTIKDKNAGFPRFMLDTPYNKLRDLKNWPDRIEPNVHVFIYKEYYLAFLTLQQYKRGEKNSINSEYFCLVFDKKGKLLKEMRLADHLVILRQSGGYLMGSIYGQDIDRLNIYRLTLPGK